MVWKSDGTTHKGSGNNGHYRHMTGIGVVWKQQVDTRNDLCLNPWPTEGTQQQQERNGSYNLALLMFMPFWPRSKGIGIVIFYALIAVTNVTRFWLAEFPNPRWKVRRDSMLQRSVRLWRLRVSRKVKNNRSGAAFPAWFSSVAKVWTLLSQSRSLSRRTLPTRRLLNEGTDEWSPSDSPRAATGLAKHVSHGTVTRFLPGRSLSR